MRTITIPLRRNERSTHEDTIAREIGALRSALAATLARCADLERRVSEMEQDDSEREDRARQAG